jgi:hypothetical protein
MVRHEDYAIAVVNADGEGTCPIPLQLFAPRTRKTPDHGQILRSVKVVQPLPVGSLRGQTFDLRFAPR